MALLRLLTRSEFYFKAEISLEMDDSPAVFSDLISAWAKDQTYFDIGLLEIDHQQDSTLDVKYRLYRFINASGTPQVSQYIYRRGGSATHLRFTHKSTEYFFAESLTSHAEHKYAISEFLAAIKRLDEPGVNFQRIRGLGNYPPLGLAMSIALSLKTGGKISREFQFEMPNTRPLTWVAPIRTKPQRIYDGLTRNYSAEGAHAPFLLKQQLKSKQFVERLKSFGEASGLFEVLSTHTFGKGTRNPFEVLIKLSGKDINIENVGYGVSQALPLIVEFLSARNPKRFAIQQPEVHLHPRAQAALGSLLFFLAQEKKHSYIVETHSDFLIDRYRLEMRSAKETPDSQVLFFSRTPEGNRVVPLDIDSRGRYPISQPSEFRDFFVREEMRLLSL